MFTGLIEFVGRVASIRTTAAGIRLEIAATTDRSRWEHLAGPGTAVGASVAINGVCLTVVEPPTPDGLLRFDAVPETLAKTTLGRLKPGDGVHLEASATPTTLLGGHIVQGHVDGVAEVLSAPGPNAPAGGDWRVRVKPPAHLMEYLVPKGSVAVEGVSLTVADLSPREGWFEIALIPTTLDKTTLRDLVAGSRVNIECDAMAKTVVHWLRNWSEPANQRASEPGGKAGRRTQSEQR